MGHHATYDHWRTTPPWDMPSRRARFAPSTVKTPLCIEDGDVTIDAYGIYETDGGALVSVEINGNAVPVHAVESALRMLGATSARWSDDLDPDALDDLARRAMDDAEADWADYRRDMREDR